MRCLAVSLLLIFLAATKMTAQSNIVTVSGYVKDGASGETLIGASITNGKHNGATSNSHGYYSFSFPAGRISISYGYLGYKGHNIEMDIVRDTSINISLLPVTMAIDEVTVIQKRPALFESRGLGSVSVDIRQLKYTPLFFGEQDIFKYLQLLPGVSPGREGSSGLNLRGGSSDQTLILLDDVPIYNQTHAFGFISIFSGEAIKNAELHKGYISPIYGGRLSGMTSLRMKDGNRYEHHQSIQVGTLSASAMLEGPIKKERGSYLISARRFVPDLLLAGIYALTDSEDRAETSFSFFDVTAKLNYDLNNKNTIYMSLYTGRDQLKVSYLEMDYDPDTGKTFKGSKSRSGLSWGNSIASMRLNTTLGHKIFMNNTLYYSFLNNRKFGNFKDYMESQTFKSDIRSRMEEFGIRSTIEHNIGKNYDLTYGLNIFKQYFSPQVIDSERRGKKTHANYGKRGLLTTALFLNNIVSFGRFDFNFGGRVAMYDNSSEKIYNFEPRVSTTLNIGKTTALWISYTENTQPLFSMDNYYYSLPIDYWIPFVDNKIPSSRQYTAGWKKTMDFGLSLSTEVYYKTSENIALIYDSDDFLLGEGGYDKAKGKALGVELLAQYRKDRFGAMVAYTYSKSEYEVNGGWTPFMYDTPHELNMMGMYDVLQTSNRKHTFSIAVNYKTGLPYTLSNQSYPVAGNSQVDEAMYYPRTSNTRLRNYFRIDLNYNMEKKLHNGTRNWQISLLNATGHQNPYVIYRADKKYKSLTLIPFLPSFSYKRTW